MFQEISGGVVGLDCIPALLKGAVLRFLGNFFGVRGEVAGGGQQELEKVRPGRRGR